MTKPKATKDQIVDAALETLKEEGFAGATSRAIARRGTFNQALVFYYFGTLDNLLLAALDATSDARLARYREVVGDGKALPELLRVTAAEYREDRASGHMTVVAQMVAGSLSKPELRPQVLARTEPWLAFAEETIRRAVAGTPLEPLVPVEEVASAVITFYFGVNLLTGLDEGRRTDALFDKLEELVPLVESLG
jgi:AcrR family transcriptional regulator